jgi:hypothetical protein
MPTQPSALRRALLAVSLALLAPLAARAACDCRASLGQCTATIEVDKDTIVLTSSSPACSRVDYRVNGVPKTSVLVNATARERWIGPEALDRVGIDGCVKCAVVADRPAQAGQLSSASGVQVNPPCPQEPPPAKDPAVDALVGDYVVHSGPPGHQVHSKVTVQYGAICLGEDTWDDDPAKVLRRTCRWRVFQNVLVTSWDDGRAVNFEIEKDGLLILPDRKVRLAKVPGKGH